MVGVAAIQLCLLVVWSTVSRIRPGWCVCVPGTHTTAASTVNSVVLASAYSPPPTHTDPSLSPFEESSGVVVGDRTVLKQQAEPVPAVIVPVYTMGLAREESRLEVVCAGGGGRRLPGPTITHNPDLCGCRRGRGDPEPHLFK
jgi:hypothetical protein